MPQPGNTHIFLTGATGYIGGSVLANLLNHPKSDSFHITVLIRSEEKLPKFRSVGVKAVIGSHSDTTLLSKLASEADVVFACADADNLDAAKAILSGLQKRYDAKGRASILIHTSGIAVLGDNAAGKYGTETIYSDLNVEQIESLKPTQMHREVDLEIVSADQKGFVKTFIVLPSTIYGIASGPLVDLGVQHSHSQQIPALVKASLDRGQGGMVGEGKNLWPNVHVDDISDLFIAVYDAATKNQPTGGQVGHGLEGFYFGENGEHRLYDISKTVSQVLYDLGKGKSPEPTTFTEEELLKYFGGAYLGSNSRCRAERSRSIGWNPKYTTQDMLASIKPEVEASLSG
ncbi:hypothetical protein SERLADRAFT_467949 [Serpula lacrymans var. lacrymans S7.9]|uniref:NAD(P)-binding domain-containing protein n=1 Tax=Serpula lacrymans var. lacrymans (strain S7.9) TaxID=578457 RepID=F8NX37_SERL9|nr:uncharacterized protein SERLADRAFT_467949 [Serpula lacrymans var. lacrymans S7.9]EGO24512.1 hypothetical protein SERLADRAFT_467949 [Serpula lacrymans var. lacrymans S7.9]